MASAITGDADYEGDLIDWRNVDPRQAGEPEISNQEPHKNTKEKGIVVDDSPAHRFFTKTYPDRIMSTALAIVHGAAHSSSEVEELKGLHTRSGITADGNSLKADYRDYVIPQGNFNAILNPMFNQTFIKGIQSRYGTNEAKDNYHNNMIKNANKNGVK